MKRILTPLVAVALGAAAAQAGPINKLLGGGWQVTIFNPIITDVQTIDVNLDDNFLNIRKIATFDAIDEITNQPVPINLVFQQVGSDAETVSRIRLDEEFLTNALPQSWIAFRNELLGSAATFDAAASAGFSIAPFTNATYAPNGSSVVFDGGSVGPGAVWSPGVASGFLEIDVDLSPGAPVVFTLKEIPQVPEPASLGLLLAGVLLLRRRP